MKKPILISSHNGILYDSYLGDYALPFYMWDKLISESGYKYELNKTPYNPYQSISSGEKLHHFICRKHTS